VGLLCEETLLYYCNIRTRWLSTAVFIAGFVINKLFASNVKAQVLCFSHPSWFVGEYATGEKSANYPLF
jgi:hypothetical protein